MTRIVICGGPKTGKTTLAGRLLFTHIGTKNNDEWLARTLRHTDDLIPLGWSEASKAAALWFNEPGPWIVEGVAAVRALRKWLAANQGKPCDVVIWLDEPHVELSPGQRGMTAGCRTIWDEIERELRERGVEVQIGAEA